MDKESSSGLSTYEIEDRLLESLKKREGEATAGDVATDTGLPYEEVEQGLRRMLSEYKSHLDVDDDGNLRYRFDPSFSRRGDQPGRWWHRFKQKAWGWFVAFFKVWTMVMLVGYTIVFVLILVGLSVAALTQDDEGGGDIAVLPFYLLARMLETLFYIDLFSRGGFGRRAQRLRQRRHAEKPDKAVYQRIFQYLFGPEAEESTDPMATAKSFAGFVRERKGRVTAAEWASRSGQSLEAADNALTAGIMRFRGDVDVTDDGALVYNFHRLRVTADDEEEGASAKDPGPIWNRKVEVPSLTGNKTSTNVWITLFNAFNLMMSSIVLFGVAGLSAGVQIGLGVIPFIFSTIFFLLPLMRRVRQSFRKKKAKQENQRRKAMSVVFKSADDGEAKPVDEQMIPSGFADRFMYDYEGDIEVTEEGETQYVFPEIALQYGAGREARRQAEEEAVVFGQTIFSSDEEEKSLEESEMDDFDERLSRELGEDVTLEDLEESVVASEPASSYA